MPLRKDTQCLLDTSAMGLMPEHWGGASDLEAFRPDRWDTFKPSKSVFMAFGIGGRICPGKQIAMNNLAVIVCFVVQRWRVAEAPAKPLEMRCGIGLSIQTDSEMVFTRRTISP